MFFPQPQKMNKNITWFDLLQISYFSNYCRIWQTNYSFLPIFSMRDHCFDAVILRGKESLRHCGWLDWTD